MEISQIYAYSIEDSSQWKGITSIANIPTLNKCILSNFIFQIRKMEISQIYAYYIEDFSRWQGIISIANI